MPTASIRRRVRSLEALYALAPIYPPFSRSELDAIEQRLLTNQRLARAEVQRLEQYSPIIDGEFLITSFGGEVFAKRYRGIDLAEI